jgi:ribulose-5-phosphate 4-epimerase/fuculose-1-phosphate aldolase
MLFDRALIGVYQNGIGFGNISVRGEEFIVSGTATGGKRVLTPGDYCLVTSFDMEENYVVSSGPVQASSESMTHGAIYRACPKAVCVIHVHSRLIFDGMLRDRFPFTPPDAAYGTPEMARAIMKAAGNLPDGGALVMSGHDEGVIAWGVSVKSAFDVIRRFDKCYGAVQGI